MKRGCLSCLRLFVLLVALGAYAGVFSRSVSAQFGVPPIPATQSFADPGCSDVELGGIDALGLVTIPSPQRTNPEWKAIITDASKPPHLQPPKILEGFVRPPSNDEKSSDQATAEVAEEDTPLDALHARLDVQSSPRS